MCAMASTRKSFFGAEGMRASIAKDAETAGFLPKMEFSKKSPRSKAIVTEKGRMGNISYAALENNSPSLLLVRLVGFRLRLGLCFRLARRGLLGCSLFAGLSLRNQQHPRAAVQVHVLPGGSGLRTLRGVRGRRV